MSLVFHSMAVITKTTTRAATIAGILVVAMYVYVTRHLAHGLRPQQQQRSREAMQMTAGRRREISHADSKSPITVTSSATVESVC